MFRTGLVMVMCSVWLLAAALFYSRLMAFDTTPGISAHAPAGWPLKGELNPTDKPTLVLFLHPKCSCSRASIAQIKKLQKLFPGGFYSLFVLWQPPLEDASWDKLPAINADQLPGTRIVHDRGGHWAQAFDAHSSGQVYFYAANGSLQFAGGATSLRGNSEDGPAFKILADVIQGKKIPLTLPVFGCTF